MRLPAVKKGSGRMLGGNKGTHSCETVGDSHSVPFLIALIRTLFIGKDMHYLLMPKIKIVVFVKYFCASKHFFLFLQPYKSIFLNSYNIYSLSKHRYFKEKKRNNGTFKFVD